MKYSATGAGITIGGTGWWLAASQQRAARWFRRLMADAKRQVQPAPVKPNPSAWSDNQITICWLGHTTVLINFYGMHILTDPVMHDRVGISWGLGTIGIKRYVAPALSPKELPPIDVVLLSHAHMDHMDVPTLNKVGRGTFTVTAKDTSDVLSSMRPKQLTELGWGKSTTFRNAKGELQLEAFQVKHWGERWPSKLVRGYNGYVLKREGKSLLFAGDTAQTPLLSEVRSRGPFLAALMPIGAYRPWIWNHCSPEQALEMANAARAQYIVPVHHQTFRLSDEPMTEPIERLKTALDHEPQRLALQRIGEHFVCPTA